LRVILRQIGDISVSLCILAALVLASASVVPYILQFPLVFHEAVAGGYCFTMAAIWLALSAIVERRVSPTRLGFASLCFGLAVGSRPTLLPAALVLIPVYLSLRPIRRHRGQLIALALPLAVCLMLLAAYNEARYGNPLEIGTLYQLNGDYQAHNAQLSYLPPGIWSYLVTPPRLSVLFPFFSIIRSQASYPSSFPALYEALAEPTGGLLVMAPITLYLGPLLWIWRRRPDLLGSLGLPLLLLASVGVAIMVFLAYYFFGTTERYEVDYTTLLLFGALAAWLALSARARGRRWRLAHIGGSLLALWSCATGLAIASQEMREPSGSLRNLVNLSSPLSTAIATVAGHAVLAEISAAHIVAETPENYDSIGTRVTGFWLDVGERANLTIVSPDSRRVELAGSVSPGPRLRPGAILELHVAGPGRSSHSYRLPAPIPVDLAQGVNRLALSARPTAANAINPSVRGSQAVVIVVGLHLAGG
jgi:hypothetical protein